MSNGVKDEKARIYIDLVDILFGIIIGTSFTQFFPISLNFQAFAVFLAYMTVIGSWVGYHRAIIKSKDKKSELRFIIDLVLLYFYAYLIFSVNDFPSMVTIFPIIFFLYFIWSFARSKETDEPFRWESYSNNKNFVFTFLFFIQFMLYIVFHERFKGSFVVIDAPLLDWLTLFISMAMIIIYRVLRAPREKENTKITFDDVRKKFSDLWSEEKKK